jgi:mycothiol maleylpyruvate isomerase-like protein
MATSKKAEALGVLRDGHREVARLVDRLPAPAMSRPGLGGGDWSPKDLLGHLTSWEEYALAAIGAWQDGAVAPIDQAIRTRGLNEVNAVAVDAKAGLPIDRVRQEFDEVHAELVRTLQAIPDDLWDAPATTRMRRPLGLKVGAILGGPGGPYLHADAHLPDLRGFVEEHARSA